MTDSEPSTAPTSLSRTRYLAGSLAWLLTLQFFVVEAVAIARFGGYSRVEQAISDLGTDLSPAAGLMNASFVAQAVLIVAGAVLLYPALVGLGGRLALVLLAAAGAGVLLVGLFPSDSGGGTHTVGAVLYLLGSGLGLIALAYGVRPRSEAVGTVLALLGLVGTIGTVFFGTGVTALLGYGGMERVAAYVLPVGLAVAAVLLLRQRDDWRVVLPEGEDAPLTKRQRRELEKAEAFDRARARDEALKAHAKKQAADRSDDEEDDEPFDEEAAWKTPKTPRQR
ncbi:DUF998 domain-containing protein [Klenkia taihuensis]|uniref:Hypothetical membrane protein n=1 Tax=Klenkia taihuensis TaxID=1225127 RepID=A0A1I1TMS5_9ACTN|nr:DUF998 domain-containing protein [Klenkia taihuensis]GHE12799.1 hypothetical protein GCM10011381_32050 [Klenkia taihuensis]SFD57763.1 hypothetical membrane protein [Klenkia taihuensis]